MEPPQVDPGEARAFRVGDWLVEPSINRLSRGEDALRVEPKAMLVLVCLARRAGQLVSRQSIIDAVWQTEFIAQNTLTHAISHLRRAFGDDPRRPRFVETITRRGYRLMISVEEVDATPAPAAGGGLACAIVVDGVQMVLSAGENLIGRASDVAILVGHTEVSRHHARIVVSPDGAFLEDLGSKNGTFLWGERLAAPARLEDRDQIAIGPSLLVFRVLSTMGTTQTARSEERD